MFMEHKFKVLFMEQAAKFLDEIEPKASEKILYNIRKSQLITDNELFKKLQDDIWEFRTLYNKTYYCLFAFWDKTERTDTLVIVSHGIVKKTSKVPKQEIDKAIKYKSIYFEQNNK